MREVFANTAYWIALTHRFDQHHEAALKASALIGTVRIITTDAVLMDYLNAFADRGAALRRAAIQSVDAILENRAVLVIAQTRRAFRAAFALYKVRPDKGYSLTDCHSMTIMRSRRISRALTTDRHFEQEGLMILMQ